jgi:hypothetical protein
MPNNIDIDMNAMEWVPLEGFPSGLDAANMLSEDHDLETDQTAFSTGHLYRTTYLKSNGIFQRISQPTSLGFDYSYDVNIDTKDPGALEYQFLHRSTAAAMSPQDEDDDEVDRPDADRAGNPLAGCDSTHPDQF